MRHHTLALFLTFCLLQPASAQMPIGSFRSHIPLHGFHSVAVSDHFVYAATDNGIMYLEKNRKDTDNPNPEAWTKVDGLSDIDISEIYFCNEYNTLIVSYKNGNLDLIADNRLLNVSDIKNKSVMGPKEISHIHTHDSIAYLVYPFGIVSLNLKTRLVTDTWFTKRDGQHYHALDLAITPDRYYLSTDKGIFSLAADHPNPANFLEWDKELPADSCLFDHLLYFGGKVYASKNTGNGRDISDTVYAFGDGVWKPTALAYCDVRSMTCSDSEMAICDWGYVDILDPALRHRFYAEWLDDGIYEDAQEAVLDHDIVWVADRQHGLAQVNRTCYYHRLYTMDGPYSNNAEAISSRNGVTVIAPGSRHGAAFAACYLPPAISAFKNGKWQYFAKDFLHFDPRRETYDLNNVIISPYDDGEWYAASWGNGLFKCHNGQIVQHYTVYNSALDSSAYGMTFVSGLAFDPKGNLWMTNSWCSDMLKMMEPDGTWHRFNIERGMLYSGVDGVIAEHLLVDSRGTKWVSFPRDKNMNKYNLVAFNENGTYDNTGDDKFARIDMNREAQVSSSTVLCLAEDLDGEIWIGTDKGVKVIHHPYSVFNEGSGASPRNILIEQDGYVSILLEFEEVTAIAVDGANRKWIGTGKAGVFLMSEDGQEQLLHFTADDHPLFSNQITSIAIDHLSGEVFFGTSKGVVSYRGTSTAGSATYEDLLVFPNPVRHGYTGPVAVKGLKYDSLCKITDAAGRLIWQGRSNGGQIVWNCRDHYGNRPATGVYYVMASDENGKERIVTKFLFVN